MGVTATGDAGGESFTATASLLEAPLLTASSRSLAPSWQGLFNRGKSGANSMTGPSPRPSRRTAWRTQEGRDSGDRLLTLQGQGDMVTPRAFWPDDR